VQRLHIDRGRARRRAPRSENVRCSTFELGFPGGNLIGVDVEMLRQLSQRSIALDGGKRHLGLESRRSLLLLVSPVRGYHRRYRAETPLIGLFKLRVQLFRAGLSARIVAASLKA
jgi:hypothetical protein